MAASIRKSNNFEREARQFGTRRKGWERTGWQFLRQSVAFGKYLIRLKKHSVEEKGHGHWLEFLQEQKFSEDIAQRLMAGARLKIKNRDLRFLKMAPAALHELRHVSSELLPAIVERAKREQLTQKQIRDIYRQARATSATNVVPEYPSGGHVGTKKRSTVVPATAEDVNLSLNAAAPASSREYTQDLNASFYKDGPKQEPQEGLEEPADPSGSSDEKVDPVERIRDLIDSVRDEVDALPPGSKTAAASLLRSAAERFNELADMLDDRRKVINFPGKVGPGPDPRPAG